MLYRKNFPPKIKLQDLLNDKLRLSASEMLFLTRYFGVLVGDLVPVDNSSWKLYLCLRKLIDVLSATRLQRECFQIIADLVSEHNRMFIKLTKRHLTFKYHVLIHYAQIFVMSGPIYLLSSMRFEAKHKPFKLKALNINSRVNITKSLAKKHQLGYAANIICESERQQLFIFGMTFEFSKKKISKYATTSKITAFISTCNGLLTNWVEFNGVKYKKNCIIIIGNDDLQFQFGIITDIFIVNYQNVYFIYEGLETIGFDAHYYAYVVQNTNNYNVIDNNNLYSHVCCAFTELNKNLKYVIVPWHM